MRVQDRLDDVLQPGSLPDDLVAARDLPAQCLGRLVGYPHFRQEPARIEPSPDARVDRVGLDLRMRDQTHLFRVCDHDPLHVRRDDGCHRRSIAGRLDDHDVVRRELTGEGGEQIATHVDAPQPLEFAVLPDHRLRESSVDIQSDDAHGCSLSGSSRRELAGNTTSTDPRSRRIRESRKGRPCNELGLAAQGLSTACPHLRAPGAPRPRWAHHRAVSRGEQPDVKAPQFTYRIMVSSSACTTVPCSTSTSASKAAAPGSRRSTKCRHRSTHT